MRILYRDRGGAARPIFGEGAGATVESVDFSPLCRERSEHRGLRSARERGGEHEDAFAGGGVGGSNRRAVLTR